MILRAIVLILSLSASSAWAIDAGTITFTGLPTSVTAVQLVCPSITTPIPATSSDPTAGSYSFDMAALLTAVAPGTKIADLENCQLVSTSQNANPITYANVTLNPLTSFNGSSTFKSMLFYAAILTTKPVDGYIANPSPSGNTPQQKGYPAYFNKAFQVWTVNIMPDDPGSINLTVQSDKISSITMTCDSANTPTTLPVVSNDVKFSLSAIATQVGSGKTTADCRFTAAFTSSNDAVDVGGINVTDLALTPGTTQNVWSAVLAAEPPKDSGYMLAAFTASADATHPQTAFPDAANNWQSTISPKTDGNLVFTVKANAPPVKTINLTCPGITPYPMTVTDGAAILPLTQLYSILGNQPAATCTLAAVTASNDPTDMGSLVFSGLGSTYGPSEDAYAVDVDYTKAPDDSNYVLYQPTQGPNATCYPAGSNICSQWSVAINQIQPGSFIVKLPTAMTSVSLSCNGQAVPGTAASGAMDFTLKQINDSAKVNDMACTLTSASSGNAAGDMGGFHLSLLHETSDAAWVAKLDTPTQPTVPNTTLDGPVNTSTLLADGSAAAWQATLVQSKDGQIMLSELPDAVTSVTLSCDGGHDFTAPASKGDAIFSMQTLHGTQTTEPVSLTNCHMSATNENFGSMDIDNISVNATTNIWQAQISNPQSGDNNNVMPKSGCNPGESCSTWTVALTPYGVGTVTFATDASVGAVDYQCKATDGSLFDLASASAAPTANPTVFDMAKLHQLAQAKTQSNNLATCTAYGMGEERVTLFQFNITGLAVTGAEGENKQWTSAEPTVTFPAQGYQASVAGSSSDWTVTFVKASNNN
tara:strand:+ start:93564 stop:96014 length:2451 start_codon:yes stop_codon:yes gene_type:complete